MMSTLKTLILQVAAVSGDVRRVLELCRKGAEVAAEEAAAAAAAPDCAAPAAGAPAASAAAAACFTPPGARACTRLSGLGILGSRVGVIPPGRTPPGEALCQGPCERCIR